MVYQITGRGFLQLHLRPDSDNFDYRLWKTHKASDSWLIASVDLPNSTAPYQVGEAVVRMTGPPGVVIAQYPHHFRSGETGGWGNPLVLL